MGSLVYFSCSCLCSAKCFFLRRPHNSLLSLNTYHIWTPIIILEATIQKWYYKKKSWPSHWKLKTSHDKTDGPSNIGSDAGCSIFYIYFKWRKKTDFLRKYLTGMLREFLYLCERNGKTVWSFRYKSLDHIWLSNRFRNCLELWVQWGSKCCPTHYQPQSMSGLIFYSMIMVVL